MKEKTQRRRVFLGLAFYSRETHKGVARFAQEAGWILDATMANYPIVPEQWNGDGMIVLLEPRLPHLTEMVMNTNLPVVSLSRDSKGLPMVLQDNRAIGKMVAEYLIDKGFTNLAYYCDSPGLKKLQDRLDGFRETTEASGLNFFHIIQPELKNSNRASTAQPFLSASIVDLPLPLGIMGGNESSAVALIDACLQIKRQIPEEIAVVSTDNDPLVCDFSAVPLSSVEPDLERRGYEAAKVLQSLMDGNAPPAQPILCPPSKVVTRRSSDIIAVKHICVAQAIRYIWDHYREKDLRVGKIAEAANISLRQLQHQFPHFTGKSLREEIERCRLERAMDQLCNSDKKAYIIAEECGFSNAEVMSKIFKRVHGISPQAYRKSCRK